MRLTKEHADGIKAIVLRYDPCAEVFLFGSRAADDTRGGDIDLLLMSKQISLDQRRKIKTQLFDLLGEQKIDLVLATDDHDPFVRIAKCEGIKL